MVWLDSQNKQHLTSFQFILIAVTWCVFFMVGTEFLCITYINLVLQKVKIEFGHEQFKPLKPTKRRFLTSTGIDEHSYYFDVTKTGTMAVQCSACP
jgi:hypothetical protein